MDVQSPIVRPYSLSFSSSLSSIHQSLPQNNLQSTSPSPSSSSALHASSSIPHPPFPVHPTPTSDEIDAIIQQATSSLSLDGRHVPLKDTRTQLFVGNVRTLSLIPAFFLFISYSSPFGLSTFSRRCSLLGCTSLHLALLVHRS
jgi:hypothetical protein